MISHRKITVFSFLFLIFYAFFWLWFFEKPTEVSYENVYTNVESDIEKSKSVLSATSEERKAKSLEQKNLPVSYKISVEPRKQFFNLSCEFAAAAGVVHYFTKDPVFSPTNQKEAEELLIKKAPISDNPNIGIRMGNANLSNVFVNLNQKFGGSEYYGVHAPPFIDILESYNLLAKPMYIDNEVISNIQKAISSGNLILAWVKIGYSSPIDDALSYGNVEIVRGEHAVLVVGFDEKGVIVMDPGIGAERHIEYNTFFDASSFFPIPFLEISRKTIDKDKNYSRQDFFIGFDRFTQIQRNVPKISIKNGSKKTGAANQLRGILKDFGYRIVGIGNADSFDYLDVNITTKKDFSDFLHLLKKDIVIAGFSISNMTSDLKEDSIEDILIVVGN